MKEIFNSNQKKLEYIKVQKQGGRSISTIIPKTIAESLGIAKGTYVRICQSDDKIIIEKI